MYITLLIDACMVFLFFTMILVASASQGNIGAIGILATYVLVFLGIRKLLDYIIE